MPNFNVSIHNKGTKKNDLSYFTLVMTQIFLEKIVKFVVVALDLNFADYYSLRPTKDVTFVERHEILEGFVLCVR